MTIQSLQAKDANSMSNTFKKKKVMSKGVTYCSGVAYNPKKEICLSSTVGKGKIVKRSKDGSLQIPKPKVMKRKYVKRKKVNPNIEYI
jgi:hypothetical protein